METAACRSCRHPHEVHVHLRAGSECSLCSCPAYRRPGLLARLRALVGERGEAGHANFVGATTAVVTGVALLGLTGVIGPAPTRATSDELAPVVGSTSSAGDRAPSIVGPRRAVAQSARSDRPTGRKPMGIAFGNRLTWMSDTELRATLDDAVALHASWVRLDLSWADLQPVSSRQWSWQRTDRVVLAARSRGLQILGVLGYTPAWARDADCRRMSCPPVSPAAFAAYARSVADRYRLQVSAYEIWNEQNSPGFWVHPSARAYARLLGPAADSVRRSDPHATIVMGGLMPTDGRGDSLRPGRFLQQVCAAGACADLDAVGYHPYCFPFLASRTTTWRTSWERMTEPTSRDLALTDALRETGYPHLKIWATEFGAPTSGPGSVTDRNLVGFGPRTDHVTEDLQALITADGIATARVQRDVGALFLYTEQDTVSPGSNAGSYGLRRADGSTKPAYAAARQALGQD